MTEQPEPERYDAVYMNKDVLKFLKAWPNDRDPIMWNRLVESRMIASPLAEINAGGWARSGPCTTNLGYQWSQVLASQSINFFGLKLVLGMWPIELLANRRPDIGEYLALFHGSDGEPLGWNTPDVRRYISAGLQAPDLLGLTKDWPADPIRRSLIGHRGFVESMEDLEAALAENIYQRRLYTNRILPDSEIPF